MFQEQSERILWHKVISESIFPISSNIYSDLEHIYFTPPKQLYLKRNPKEKKRSWQSKNKKEKKKTVRKKKSNDEV
jgi:hypothetical protein